MAGLSVVLCTYNGEAFLGEQLDSIASQTRRPDELLIRDDGSTDATLALVESFRARVPFPVRVHVNPANVGTSQNVAGGLAQAQGDLIALADQDDVWYPHKLATLEGALAVRPDAGMAFSDADVIDSSGGRTGERLWESVRFDRAREVAFGNAFRVFLRRPAVTGATVAIRAEMRWRILPIPAGWVHDEWIALVVSAVAGVVPITEPLMGYRRHEGNQVGLNPSGLVGQVQAAAGRERAEYLDRARGFVALRDRVAAMAPDQPDLRDEIDAKGAHLEMRASLPEARLARLPAIAREVALLRYSRYSGSVAAGLADWLRGP
jgi:glycosyltransferase involved in cell wall biosynthesis